MLSKDRKKTLITSVGDRINMLLVGGVGGLEGGSELRSIFYTLQRAAMFSTTSRHI